MNNYSQTASGQHSLIKANTPKQYIRGQGELTPGFVPYSPINTLPINSYNKLFLNKPQPADLPGKSVIAYITDIFD